MKSNRRTGQGRRLVYHGIFIFFFALAACMPVPADNSPDRRVVILGDSIMRTLSHSLKRELAKHPGFSAFSFSYLRPGLSQTADFDWFARIQKILGATNPDIAVVMMGVNDKQTMHIRPEISQPADRGEDAKLSALKAIQVHEPDWTREYSRRIGAVMDIMIAAGVRQIFWIELPDMRDAKLQEDSIAINKLIQQEAESRPRVVFQPSKNLLSRTPGVYSRYIYETNGLPLHVRAVEGVNLNENGANILTREIVAGILKTWNNNAP